MGHWWVDGDLIDGTIAEKAGTPHVLKPERCPQTMVKVSLKLLKVQGEYIYYIYHGTQADGASYALG